MRFTETDVKRFERFVEKDGACWRWTGASVPGASSRYPDFSVKGKSIRAHRFSYLAFNGEIPTGTHVDHICRNTLCVNPKHLRVLSPRENTLIGIGPSANNARKTKCVNGHPFSGENLKIKKNGVRVCRTCERASGTKYNRKRRSDIREIEKGERGE